ncbi:NAD(P)-dependent oxidoreductase [Enterococcus cecorum]|uniref:NAD(P)-dependent oxidoreductase n=1 Tax=Enterococcus cecorum TaxID=44008 RepID=UPI0006438F9A|nr:NAD(P)H-binding protein [Enterococcus cecorum]KLO74439.1 NADH-flavin reductase [Enterococcus cecorum]
MKLMVIGSNGKAAKEIIKEAKSRGLEVVGVARSANQNEGIEFVQKDLFDLTKEDLVDVDVVIDAFGAWTPETLPLHTESLKKLGDLVANTEKRLLVVGGAGSLYVDDSLTTQLFQTPDFPESYLPVANAMEESLAYLRTRDDVNWTYVSPAADFQAEGKRTGDYLLAGEVFTVNDRGESVISYADYAIAMVDEAQKGHHIKERISVLAK